MPANISQEITSLSQRKQKKRYHDIAVGLQKTGAHCSQQAAQSMEQRGDFSKAGRQIREACCGVLTPADCFPTASWSCIQPPPLAHREALQRTLQPSSRRAQPSLHLRHIWWSSEQIWRSSSGRKRWWSDISQMGWPPAPGLPTSLMSASHLAIPSLLTICPALGYLSLVSSEFACYFKEIFLFPSVFFLLLSAILSSKTGIGSLAITWLQRERTADGGTKTMKQFSFSSSQVQLLVLPDY